MAARKRGTSARKTRSGTQTTKVSAGRGRKVASVKPRKSASKTAKKAPPRRRRTDVAPSPAERDALANGIRR
jgi:hypothetical protein